jgi:hypothetical protein
LQFLQKPVKISPPQWFHYQMPQCILVLPFLYFDEEIRKLLVKNLKQIPTHTRIYIPPRACKTRMLRQNAWTLNFNRDLIFLYKIKMISNPTKTSTKNSCVFGLSSER